MISLETAVRRLPGNSTRSVHLWFGHQTPGAGQPRHLSCLVTRLRELSSPPLTCVPPLLPLVLRTTVKKSPRVGSLQTRSPMQSETLR